MITRTGRELVEAYGALEKNAWLADVLSSRMLRGVGKLFRTSVIPMKAVYHGAKAVGRGAGHLAGAGARGLERTGDAMRKYPVRAAYLGIPAVYGASQFKPNLHKNMNNIHPNNPYMYA